MRKIINIIESKQIETDDYNKASDIRNFLNSLPNNTQPWKLKEVKQALEDAGFKPITKRLVNVETGKEVKANDVYNVHLNSVDPRYKAIDHAKKIADNKAGKDNYKTVEGYLYDIRILNTNHTNGSMALYLINSDGEKVCHTFNTVLKRAEDGTTYSITQGDNRYWFNKLVQQDYIRDRARRGEQVMGLHFKFDVRVSGNECSVVNVYMLDWDSTSERIYNYYGARELDLVS